MRAAVNTGVFACAVSLIVAGCGSSFWSARESNPVIQDSVTPNVFGQKSVDMFATTASRRVILIYQNADGSEFASCAEPPPDVGEAFSAAIGQSECSTPRRRFTIASNRSA